MLRCRVPVFEDMSDGELARAVVAGAGAPAEAAVVARFRRRVFLYGMRHLRDEAGADDLSQDVMATVLARLRAGEVEDAERLGSFILGVARWTVHDRRRRERRGREIAETAAREGESIVAPREPAETEALSAALATLSERERAVVLLTFHEDKTAAEIGEAIGAKPGHVRVLRHRAIARLAQVMGVEVEDERAQS